MAAQEMAYFKFVSALIDSGIWAEMSPAARALYPVLLRFSDRNFKPVYPGTQTLLKLTGFKQKSSLRKARRELVELGLISVTEGTGRKNSYYHFRFDWGDSTAPPSGLQKPPPAVSPSAPPGGISGPGRGAQEDPAYNQIHISINNHVPDSRSAEGEDTSREAFLVRRFGQKSVDLARSECNLAGIPPTTANLEKILYRHDGGRGTSWAQVEKLLSEKISPGSLDAIREAFREESGGVLLFSDALPGFLKNILRQVSDSIFFEPGEPGEPVLTRRQFWKGADTEL